MQKKITRRQAIKTLGTGTLAVSILPLWACSPMARKNALGDSFAGSGMSYLDSRRARFPSISPIQRDIAAITPREFSGDNPVRPHEALWAKDAFLQARGGIPAPSEQAEVVIVGGGISGLFSAWLMKEQQPIVLEQAPRFGGNSRGERWNGIDYSIGAAYFMEHEEDSEIYTLFKELGLYDLCRTKEVDDPVYFNNQLHDTFWEGSTDPANAKQFIKLARHFADMNKNHSGLIYPEIPAEDAKMRSYVNKLDKESFHAYMKRINGGPLHPHINTVLEHYCWSTLAAGMKDVSAAVALNAYAAEFGKVYVAPGGNSRLAERTMEKIVEYMPIENLRSDALVVDVRVVGKSVHVTYSNPYGVMKTIEAKTCIMACPKFVVGKVLHGIEPARAKAISQLNYHPYLVANVCLNKKIKAEFYDAFLMKDGKVDSQDLVGSSRRHQSTDMVLATFASPTASSTILTLYRPLPWRAARAEIYADGSYDRARAEFEREIRTEILPIVGASVSDIADLRITRWGHPIPVGAPGMIHRGVAEAAHQPFKGRVFFVEQDNWMLPAIETCATEALRWTPKARALVDKG
jgi:hypothetical protein